MPYNPISVNQARHGVAGLFLFGSSTPPVLHRVSPLLSFRQRSQAGTSSLPWVLPRPAPLRSASGLPLCLPFPLGGTTGLPPLPRAPSEHRGADQVSAFAPVARLPPCCAVSGSRPLCAAHFLSQDPAGADTPRAIRMVFPLVGTTPVSFNRPGLPATQGKKKAASEDAAFCVQTGLITSQPERQPEQPLPSSRLSWPSWPSWPSWRPASSLPSSLRQQEQPEQQPERLPSSARWRKQHRRRQRQREQQQSRKQLFSLQHLQGIFCINLFSRERATTNKKRQPSQQQTVTHQREQASRTPPLFPTPYRPPTAANEASNPRGPLEAIQQTAGLLPC